MGGFLFHCSLIASAKLPIYFFGSAKLACPSSWDYFSILSWGFFTWAEITAAPPAASTSASLSGTNSAPLCMKRFRTSLWRAWDWGVCLPRGGKGASADQLQAPVPPAATIFAYWYRQQGNQDRFLRHTHHWVWRCLLFYSFSEKSAEEGPVAADTDWPLVCIIDAR